MQVSVEHLYYFLCDECKRRSVVVDIQPEINSVIYCRHCSCRNVVEKIEDDEEKEDK